LVVSDYSSNLRKLAVLVARLDVPRPSPTLSLSVALLQGVIGKEPQLPEPFKQLDLAKETGRNRFTPAGEGMARITAGPVGRTAPPPLGLRFSGSQPYFVEAAVAADDDGGLLLETFSVNAESPADKKVTRLFYTRLALKEGDWTLAGTIPATGDEPLIVVLVKASRVD
jgi:hypothetical protein